MSDAPEAVALFFQLTTASLASLNHLKRSELLIFLYLKTISPFPDRAVPLDLMHLKQVTGLRSLGTIYPALAELHRQRLIRWTNVKSNVQVCDLAATVSTQTVEGRTRSAGRSYDRPADRAIGRPIARGLEVANSERSQGSKTNKTNKTEIKKAEEFIFSEEYRRWIKAGIDAYPKPPKGHERARMIENALLDATNQELFLQEQGEATEAIFAAAAASAENFQQTQLTEQVEDTLELMIVRKRAQWKAYSRTHGTIRLWCEENGVQCGKDGPIAR